MGKTMKTAAELEAMILDKMQTLSECPPSPAARCAPANVAEYFIARPGESVSAIQISSGGALHVIEII
jgi:hypothetical protein